MRGVPPKRRIQAVATGRVQGVGFRWSVLHAARLEGLAGWVRNDPDGTVSFEAEGEAEAVERFLSAVRRLPPPIRVDDLAARDVPPVGEEGEFRVRF